MFSTDKEYLTVEIDEDLIGDAELIGIEVDLNKLDIDYNICSFDLY